MGIPTDEGQLLRSFSMALEMERMLRDQGLPISGVYMLPESTHHLVVVGVKPIYANIATQISQLVFGSKFGAWFHMVLVVDDKTDIYNKDEIIHALCTRCHPVTGIRVTRARLRHPAQSLLQPGGAKIQQDPQGSLRLSLPAGMACIRPAHQGGLQQRLPQGDTRARA